ncbi:DUF4367 domain-containing protein [Paenibacillus ehimensis]|uniref:DUF4367 domain-containing protein n=1 Tax=Paenibacillus ehimensis TaxID=79264 RepID=UPI000472B25B|nr:DUF4367 domain-containing protein [Paenibacillus ehimensis]
MSQQKRRNHFAAEMDSFLQQEKSSDPIDTEVKPLLEVSRMLAERDYSKKSDKEVVYRRIMNSKFNEKETKEMKKRKIRARFSVTVASLAIVGGISLFAVQPSSASELINKIINTISLGYISVSQMEPTPDGAVLSDEMKKQAVVTQKGEQPPQVNTLEVKDPEKLNQYTAFDVRLPSYLPEGYAFDRAEFYEDEDGTVSNAKYINIYYVNERTGKLLFMQQRFADEETAFSAATSNKIDLVKINGTDAIMSGEHTLDWEAGGVLYALTGKELQREEIIKIAESIRR